MYTYIHKYRQTYTHAHIHTHTHIHTYMHSCMNPYIYIYIYIKYSTLSLTGFSGNMIRDLVELIHCAFDIHVHEEFDGINTRPILYFMFLISHCRGVIVDIYLEFMWRHITPLRYLSGEDVTRTCCILKCYVNDEQQKMPIYKAMQ